MKKFLFLTMAAVVVAVSANAQGFSKKDLFLNANISGLNLEHEFVSGGSATAFDLNVGGGYFISDKFAIDALIGIGYAKTKGVDGASAFGFGAGVRYYPAGNFFAKVGYDGLKAKNVDLASRLGLTVGYDCFLSEKVFFEPAVYYKKNLAKKGPSTVGLSLGVGVKF